LKEIALRKAISNVAKCVKLGPEGFVPLVRSMEVAAGLGLCKTLRGFTLQVPQPLLGRLVLSARGFWL
jgi:hypothetical protein